MLVGCTSNDPRRRRRRQDGNASTPAATTTTRATRSPSASPARPPDHGWIAAINTSAQAQAKKYEDIDFKQAEGTNDPNLQISQVETFINDKVDAIVLLPPDGAALTDVGDKAMDAGIPVINVDREFSSPFAARRTILGDNYGMGVSAGTYAPPAEGEQDSPTR